MNHSVQMLQEAGKNPHIMKFIESLNGLGWKDF